VLYVDALDASFFPCGRDLLAEFLAFKADIVFQADDFDWRAPLQCEFERACLCERASAPCSRAAAVRRGGRVHGSSVAVAPRLACLMGRGGRAVAGGARRAALAAARTGRGALRARARGARALQAQREGRDQERPVPQAAAGRAPQLQARPARGAPRRRPAPAALPPARAHARHSARRLLCAGAWMGRVGAVRHYLSRFFLAAGHVDGRAWDDQGCAPPHARHGPRLAWQGPAGHSTGLGCMVG